MSVIVKNMEMPPSCYFCGLADTSFIRCEAFSPTKLLEDDCEERRPDWCPLIEIPEDVRMIDANRLLTDRMKSKYYHLPNGDTAIPIIDIEHAPTVLEAEEE